MWAKESGQAGFIGICLSGPDKLPSVLSILTAAFLQHVGVKPTFRPQTPWLHTRPAVIFRMGLRAYSTRGSCPRLCAEGKKLRNLLCQAARTIVQKLCSEGWNVTQYTQHNADRNVRVENGSNWRVCVSGVQRRLPLVSASGS